MTPLNSIISNSQMVLRRILEFHEAVEEKLLRSKDPKMIELVEKSKETMFFTRAITQSGMLMWFYNTNQIMRMKIRKQEIDITTQETAFPEVHIEKVISEFVPMITARKLQLYFYRKN